MEAKMTELERLSKERISSGGAAVSRLFNGLLAGAAMAVYLVLAGLLLGQGVRFMDYFAAGVAVSPHLGIFCHLSVSAVYKIMN
jgi:hypothetical protein